MIFGKSPLEKCFKYAEKAKVNQEKVFKSLYKGNTILSDFRTSKLEETYSSMDKQMENKMEEVQNKYFTPISIALKRDNKASKKMRWKKLINSDLSDEIEEDYKMLKQADELINKTLLELSSYNNELVRNKINLIGESGEYGEVEEFRNYVTRNANKVIKGFDESIEKIKRIRKTYKKTGTVDTDLLEKTIEEGLDNFEHYEDFAQDVKSQYKQKVETAKKRRDTLNDQVRNLTQGMESTYQDSKYQTANKIISEVQESLDEYPTVGDKTKGYLERGWNFLKDKVSRKEKWGE